MMFLKSYEKGETVYYSMLSRGYSDHSSIYQQNQKLTSKDFSFVIITILLVITLELMSYTSFI